MQRVLAALVAALLIGGFLCLLGIPVFAALRQRRRDRFRTMSHGETAEALITRVVPRGGSDGCRVRFSFQAEVAGPAVEATQKSTLAALKSLGLSEGSRVRVHFLPKWPRYAFSDGLAVAERVAAVRQAAAGNAPDATPSVHFISYTPPPGVKPVPNAFRWSGDGDITLTAEVVRFTAQRARPFWFPKVVEEECPRSAIDDVEVFDNCVRCQVALPYQKPRPLQFWALDAEEAKAIGARLPDLKTSAFAPQLAERAAFNSRLLEVSPSAPVTPVLIGINVVMFLIAAALGGGIFVPKGDVLIRLGSDYTPLTAAGESWRLLTSIFLHFGILHLAFNMWALWVNGLVAERLYGSSRYLTLYLVAGVAGSITSFLCHPLVNGAGASGAIFGVLGALYAYFLRGDSGVPNSVLRAQRKAAGLFIVVSLLSAARIKGIDNAAHLGGLAAGFVMGWLLARPLDPKRDERDWSGQWVQALAVVGGVLLVGYYVSSVRSHRVTSDADGHPIAAAPRTFGGVTLGMSTAELLRAKGTPVEKSEDHWTYNSIDPAHDGLLEVSLTGNSTKGSPRVWAVTFWGKPEAEPPGLANLLGLTRQDMVLRYGAPAHEGSVRGYDLTYLYFDNGVMVRLEGDRVRGYGVYEDPNQ